MIKNSIRRYLLAVYSGHYFWSSFDNKYNLSKDTIVGHISCLVIFVFITITAILSRLNIIKWEVNLKEYRLFMLAVMGVLAYILIIKPINKYIKTNITSNNIEEAFEQGNFTKKNTLKYYLWVVFALPVMFLSLFFFIKFIVYPIVDLLK